MHGKRVNGDAVLRVSSDDDYRDFHIMLHGQGISRPGRRDPDCHGPAGLAMTGNMKDRLLSLRGGAAQPVPMRQSGIHG